MKIGLKALVFGAKPLFGMRRISGEYSCAALSFYYFSLLCQFLLLKCVLIKSLYGYGVAANRFCCDEILHWIISRLFRVKDTHGTMWKCRRVLFAVTRYIYIFKDVCICVHALSFGVWVGLYTGAYIVN